MRFDAELCSTCGKCRVAESVTAVTMRHGSVEYGKEPLDADAPPLLLKTWFEVRKRRKLYGEPMLKLCS